MVSLTTISSAGIESTNHPNTFISSIVNMHDLCLHRLQQAQGRLVPALKDDAALSGCQVLESFHHTLAMLNLNAKFACLKHEELVESGR